MNQKKKVVVIYGGESTEHEISCRSAAYILKSIDADKYETFALGITKGGDWYPQNLERILTPDTSVVPIIEEMDEAANAVIESMMPLSKNQDLRDSIVVFPIVHGNTGEDGKLQGFLELTGIPFVGPDTLGSAAAMDKVVAKTLVASHGVEVAKSVVMTKLQWERDRKKLLSAIGDLGERVFIKPSSLGSSVGISSARTKEEIITAVDLALTFDHKVIVEEAITGREIEFAVLGGAEPRISTAGEIASPDGFYSYDEKYSDTSSAKVIVPADVKEEELARGQKLAKEAFQALNLYGMARIDFFLESDGNFVFNEANTLPGFTSISQYPKLWEHEGLDGKQLVSLLLESAIDRHVAQKKLLHNRP